MTTGPARLRVAQAATWEGLCALVGESLSEPLDDPFSADVVVVPGRGHGRALAQALSRVLGGTDGVCAGVAFPTLPALRRDLEAGALGLEPGADPWRPAALPAAILGVVASAAEEDWADSLRAYLWGPEPRPGRRAAFAADAAALFARYNRRCPDLLASWEADGDGGPGSAALAPLDRWQPGLWRALVAALAPWPPPERRHDRLVARLAASGAGHPGADKPLWLPARLGVVTVEPLSRSDRDLVEAVAGCTPTTLFEHAPRRASPTPGGFALRYGALLGTMPSPPAADSGPAAPATLLQRLQADIAAQRPPGPSPDRRADGTVQIHASHGPDRQVEVLREVLCGLMDDDPTLQPRDVLVLCCDPPGYAPLIEAAFAPGEPTAAAHPGRRLRAQVSASLVPTSPVVDCLADILALPAGRATVHDLIDLCGQPWVAARFGLTAEDLVRLPELLSAAGVVWGLDQAHRDEAGLPGVRVGTWAQGVHRLNAAVALAETPAAVLGGLSPAEAVDGGDVDLVGKLSELVSRVRLCRLECAAPASLPVWSARLRRHLGLLLAPVEDVRPFESATALLEDLAEVPTGGAPVGLDDLLGLLRHLARGAQGRPVYGNGSLLFAPLGDLDGLPYRVICLLGLDDTHFPPRVPSPAGDLTESLAAPEGGVWPDDPRVRARAHLCQAILAARSRLIVVTQGADPRTNQPWPASVPILDLLDACAVPGGPGRWRSSSPDDGAPRLVRQHSLQPYAWTNFAAEAHAWPFSFDEDALRGATRLLSPPAAPPPPLWQAGFAPPGGGEEAPGIEIEALVRFLQSPADDLLRRRARLRLKRWEQTLPDELLLPRDTLGAWRVGNLILSDLLAGTDPDTAARHARLATGTPPGRPGQRLIDQVGREAAAIARAAERWRIAPRPRAIEVACAAGGPVRGQVEADAGRLVVTRYGWIQASHLIDAWIRLLALAAGRPDDPVPLAVLIGKGPPVGLQAPTPETAAALLRQVVALHRAGTDRLVPLPPQTAQAYVRADRPGRPDGPDQARLAWEGGWSGMPGEGTDPAWSRFFPDGRLEALLAPPPEPGDPAPDGPVADGCRFVRLAAWFWRPLLGARVDPAALGRVWDGRSP